MKTFNFFAFDIGATSGRSILATLTDGKLEMEEMTRFPNKIQRIHNKYYWNIFSLFEALKEGLKVVASKGVKLDAIGIDTWGVDFVYLGEDGSILGLPRSYRDPYTNGIPEEYFRIIPRKEVYELTGIQIMNFNSIFQLFAAKKENSSALNAAKDVLFMPDALSYLLTGKKVCEYTIASTSQLLNPRTKNFEPKLFEAMDINPSIMQPIVMPGEVIGYTTDNINKDCGLNGVPVVAVAGHDTGSAVAAVPAENENFAYLSSGTWSLMGIEVKDPIINEDSFQMNFTNEGGVGGTTRFLKNITGMWLLEQCRKEWETTGTNYSYPQIVELSGSVEGFQSLIDPDDPSFANPESMTKAIVDFCVKTKQKAPVTHADFIRCIFDSLAMKYKAVLDCLQKVAPFTIEKLHVIGGGSQNALLNQMTANSIGIPVVAGPAEATAIGNVMMQAKGVGAVSSLSDMRKVIRNSTTPTVFEPKDSEVWNKHYQTFIQISK
ncbi:rhamnulokinase [Dysgonomonas sp. 216]|uniref:rhamnulokinase n=1 Tax=Dysgonomonas sp. 216 TaxID=2302934 RepID=UPI0013D32206|nr:rhamnulokinase family protein [Dysgonomonas sp. 216]NDW18988.1 rhamnulokinase [Dysgonomonas sp. 216]